MDLDRFLDILDVDRTKVQQVREIVPVEEWLENPFYCGEDGLNLYDFWKTEIADFVSRKFVEWIIYGSLGGGKTTAGCTAFIRRFYELSCYDFPPLMFELLKSTILYFIYFSVSLTQAHRTGFGKIQRLVDSIPYFRKYFSRNPNITSELQFQSLRLVYGSAVAHQIGVDVYGSALDEGDFFKTVSSGLKEINKARELYTALMNRRASRFSVSSDLPVGLLVLISSPAYESDFVERRISRVESSAYNEGLTKVTMMTGFKVKKGRYSSEYFYVHPGSAETDALMIRTIDDFISLVESLKMTKHLPEGWEGYSIHALVKSMEVYVEVEQVPMEFYDNFEEDIETAVRDILGLRTRSKLKFMTRGQAMKQTRSWMEHPFSRRLITISTEDDRRIEDFWIPEKVWLTKDLPRFIHIDQSVTTDRTGMASSVILAEDLEKPNTFWFGVEWMLAVVPPVRGQIPIIRCAEFIVWLRDQGFNIRKVTMDSYQSYASLQYLNASGISAELLSVDRTDEAYVYFKTLALTDKVIYYDYPIYISELDGLLHNRQRRKVDHSEHTSKDVSDAVVGSIWTAYTTPDRFVISEIGSTREIVDELMWEEI